MRDPQKDSKQDQKPEELWKDPKNWRCFGIYYCKEDPRLIVPKRIRWTGWTINFAHPRAFVFVAAIIAVAGLIGTAVGLLLG